MFKIRQIIKYVKYSVVIGRIRIEMDGKEIVILKLEKI